VSGVLVDSDILIEVLRQRKPEIDQRWMDLINADHLVFYSPVSLAEIRHGMRERERELIERAFSRMRCVPIAIEIAMRAGDYLRAFRASHALALGDALIAATASFHDLELWTQNHKHFPMKDVKFFTK
jgi:predicted nucleic acid-binding protein